jgi:hypothetical protein
VDIKQEDLIKFWTYFSFKKNKHFTLNGWDSPLGLPSNLNSQSEIAGYLPQIRLENIFEYAIPKLQDKGYAVTLTAFEHKGFRVEIQHISNEFVDSMVDSDDPTEALYKAIMEVIKNADTN